MACPLHYATCVTLKIEKTSKQGPAPAGAAAVLLPEHGFLWIDRDGFPKAFAADVDGVEACVMAAVQKPLSINSFTAKSGPPAWKHLASRYMVATEEQMIPPQAEEFMAKRNGRRDSQGSFKSRGHDFQA
jgi:hypothetical protein